MMMETKIREAEDIEDTKETLQRVKKIAAHWPPEDSSIHSDKLETASRSCKFMYVCIEN